MNIKLKLPSIKRVTGPQALAREILAIVEAEEHYDQSIWLSGTYMWKAAASPEVQIVSGHELREILTRNVCGTTACVAGNAVILSIPARAKYDFEAENVVFADGSTEYVWTYARKALRISNYDANWLFEGDRRHAEVIAALRLLAKGKSITPMVEAHHERANW